MSSGLAFGSSPEEPAIASSVSHEREATPASSAACETREPASRRCALQSKRVACGPSNPLLNQVAMVGARSRMFVREPQKHESDNRHQYVNWKNQSHIPGRKIVRRDHLVNVTASCAERESRRRNQRSKAERQARSECNYSRNSYAQICESHFRLERTIFPADKLTINEHYQSNFPQPLPVRSSHLKSNQHELLDPSEARLGLPSVENQRARDWSARFLCRAH